MSAKNLKIFDTLDIINAQYNFSDIEKCSKDEIINVSRYTWYHNDVIFEQLLLEYLESHYDFSSVDNLVFQDIGLNNRLILNILENHQASINAFFRSLIKALSENSSVIMQNPKFEVFLI